MKAHITGDERAGISKGGGATLKAEKMKNSRMPLVRIWEEGERRRVQEQAQEEKRLEQQRKLQEMRGDQWYLPKELDPVKGDNFSVLRTLQEQSGPLTMGVLDSTKPMAPVDPIIPSAPTMPDADNMKNASGNVDSFGRFQASAPSQTAADTQCSLPSYEEAINGI